MGQRNGVTNDELQKIRAEAATEELARALPLGPNVTWAILLSVSHGMLVAADNAEFDAKRAAEAGS